MIDWRIETDNSVLGRRRQWAAQIRKPNIGRRVHHANHADGGGGGAAKDMQRTSDRRSGAADRTTSAIIILQINPADNGLAALSFRRSLPGEQSTTAARE